MWKKILDAFKSFLFNFLKSAAKQQLELLMPIAQGVVKQIASDPSMVTSSDKRNAAFELIGSQIGAAEKSIPEYLINLSLELAVAELKQLTGK